MPKFIKVVPQKQLFHDFSAFQISTMHCAAANSRRVGAEFLLGQLFSFVPGNWCFALLA